MRPILLGLSIALGVAFLSGCGAGWYNRGTYPYISPSDPGTPADRTGGARPGKVQDPAYPPRESTNRSRSSNEIAQAAIGFS
jgi:hypothetical protein